MLLSRPAPRAALCRRIQTRDSNGWNHAVRLAVFDRMPKPNRLRASLLVVMVLSLIGCSDPARPGNKEGKAIDTSLLCACKPTHITKDDWRIEFKNDSLPDVAPQDLSIAAILAWPEGQEPGARTPRSARELILYRVPKAYLQSLFLRKSDCDLHMEVSETPDRSAPRVIIETPGTMQYCAARTSMYAGLKARRITITELNQELATPLSVEIVGVPFRDQAHPIWFARGSDKVATLWELHPAIVKLSP